MSEVRAVREIVHGARCPGRVLHGMRCPGRLLALRDSSPSADGPERFRCNGPDAHEIRSSRLAASHAADTAPRDAERGTRGSPTLMSAIGGE